jgi:hypothetical protein
MNGVVILSFAAKAIHSAGTLFDLARIPCKIMMYYMSAVPVQIDSFSHDFAANQDIRKERGVKCSHQASPLIAIGSACSYLDVCERCSLFI